MNWQPIETAPKDGTVVDLCGPGWDGKYERWCNARWLGEAEWEGWHGPWSDGFESPLPSKRFKPTHWMLPPEWPVPNEQPSRE